LDFTSRESEDEALYYVSGSCLRIILKILPTSLHDKLKCVNPTCIHVPLQWVQIMDRGGLIYPNADFYNFVKSIWTKLESSSTVQQSILLHDYKQGRINEDKSVFLALYSILYENSSEYDISCLTQDCINIIVKYLTNVRGKGVTRKLREKYVNNTTVCKKSLRTTLKRAVKVMKK